MPDQRSQLADVTLNSVDFFEHASSLDGMYYLSTTDELFVP